MGVEGWFHRVRVEPGANTQDPLLFEGLLDPRDFTVALREVLSGRRTLRTVAEERLRAQDFAALLRYLPALPPSDAEALREAAEQALQTLRSDLQARLGELERRAEPLLRLGLIPAVKSELVTLRDRIGQIPLHLPSSSTTHTLAQLEPRVFKGLDEDLDLIRMECEDAEVRQRRQREAERQELLTRKREADRHLDDLIVTLDAESKAPLLDSIDKLRVALNLAFRQQDLGRLRDLAGRAVALTGDSPLVELPEVPGSPSPPSLRSEPRPSLTRTRLATVDELGWLTREELKGDDPGLVPNRDQLQQYAPRRFDPSWLAPMASTARRLFHEAPKDRSPLRVFLDATGKLRLLDRRFRDARSFFGDALHFAAEDPERGRFGDSAAWGFLLAVLLPRLPPDEAARALTTENLASLCERRIGVVPLGLLDLHRVFPELGAHLFHLATPAATLLLREHLANYLVDHLNAAAELLQGVCAEIPTTLPRTPDVLEWLAVFVDEVLMEERHPAASSLRDAAKRLREASARPVPILNDLCDRLVATKDHSGLLEALQEGLKAAADRVGQEGLELSHRLLTREVPLSAEARLVIEVTSRGAPLRDLSTQVELRGAEGALRDASGPVQGGGYLLPEERREVLVPLRQDAVSATEVLVRQRVAVIAGTARLLKENNFQVQVRSAPGPALPPNPYVQGNRVSSEKVFKGRKQEMDELFNRLVGSDQDNVLLVHGERRIGKTSLLYQFAQSARIRQRYDVTLLSFENLPPDLSSASLFRTVVLSPLRERLRQWSVPVPALDERLFNENPNEGFVRFMERLDEVYQGRPRRLLLVLDEIGYLLEAIDRAQKGAVVPGALSMDVMATLRKVIQQTTCVSFILSGATHQVKRLVERRDALLFKLPVALELRELEEDAARALIREPVESVFQLIPAAVERILQETFRQPYLIQQLCADLYDRLVRRRALVATETDVLEVIDRTVSSSSHFTHLDDLLQADRERRILRALASLQADRYVKLEDLRRQLRRSGLSLTSDEIGEDLLAMQARSRSLVVRKPSSRVDFRLTVGLYARYLRTQIEDLRGLRLSAR